MTFFQLEYLIVNLLVVIPTLVLTQKFIKIKTKKRSYCNHNFGDYIFDLGCLCNSC